MNIYRPYETLADTKECLHLKEPDTRERIHFIIYRILPVFILLFAWFVLQENHETLPMGWNYLLISVAILSSAILIFRSYITELKITEGELYMLQKTVRGAREITLDLGAIEKVVLKRKRGRSAGIFFVLHTKTKSTYTLLRIPALYVDEHHITLISKRLEQMLQTKVTDK